jgi:hypothetical protein
MRNEHEKLKQSPPSAKDAKKENLFGILLNKSILKTVDMSQLLNATQKNLK